MTLRNSILSLLALATLTAGSVAPSLAQSNPPVQCQAQIAALNSGARDMKGWERIGECASTAGGAIAAKLRSARSESDSVYLLNLLSAAGQMQEPNVWQAGVDLADDAGATLPARVSALLVQLWQYDPGLTPFVRRNWQTLVTVPWSGVCSFDHAQTSAYRSSVSLPANAYSSSAAHLDALAASPSAPAVVKNLAKCVREAMANSVPETVDPSLIQFDYVCGTKYRVRNTGATWVDVTYQLYHVSEHGDLTVAPGGEATFFTDAPYAVALYYGGQLIRDAQNGQATCPP